MKLLDTESTPLGFEFCSSQTFATVIFDRSEDAKKHTVTTIKGGKVKQFTSCEVEQYNPSSRRTSSCVYLKEEGSNKFVKVCTIQHKGLSYIELLPVSNDEIVDLFLNN